MPFIDLQAQRRRLAAAIDMAVQRVLDHGQFIMGPEVAALEAKLAEFAGCKHCITCANGTDALALAIRAKDIGPGDAVFIPSFTYVAAAEAAVWAGATPVLIDVRPDTFNMDAASLEAAIPAAIALGLKPRAVIPVDLFGQPADYEAIATVAGRHGLLVIADGAQSFGATLHGKRVGRLAEITTTSFFPAKPLGCYGDGGAIFTDDDELARLLRSLRTHGQGNHKYDHVRIGVNSRLDTLQAAFLIEKLTIFADELVRRQEIAERYRTGLGNLVTVPRLIPGATSSWAQYTLVLEDRDRIAVALKAAGIPTVVYYPIPAHRQAAYHSFPTAPGGAPVSERLAGEVLSLPMHAYLDTATQDRIIEAVRAAL